MRELDAFIAKCEENATPDDKINCFDIPPLTDEELEEFKPAHPENFLINKRVPLREMIAPQQSTAQIRG